MAVEVEGPDGTVIEFPDGTTPDVIKGVMAKRYQPQAKRESVGTIPAALEGAAQGVTFGFSDEIEGGARALYGKLTGDQRPISELYSEGVAKPRERIKDAAATNPWAYYPGEVGASLLVPGGLAKLGIAGPLASSAGRGLGARSVAAAKEGAGYGAAYGAGKSEGGPVNMLTDAAAGMGTGAALGAAIPGAVDVASAVGRQVLAPFRGAMQPKTFAAEKFGEAVARDVPAEVGGPARFASRLESMQEANPSARAMDAGGENVRGLMRAANNMPNAARDGTRRMVDARQAGQHVRITDELEEGLGAARGFYATIDEQVGKMEEFGSKVLQPALKQETPLTQKLSDVFQRPTMQELAKLVGRKLQDEGKEVGPLTRTELIHRVKIELDDQIGMAIKAQKMGNKPQAGWDKGTLVILKRDLLNAVDNPQYKTGLRLYAGEARLKTAAEEGFENFRTSAPEEITAALKAFDTDAERQIYRMGAARAIVDQVRKGNANLDRTDGVFSSPEMQMKLKALFPSQKEYREFQKSLVIEAKMADSRKALQGNSTTAKQLAEGGEAGKTAGLVTSVVNAAGGKLQPALDLMARGYNRFTGMTPRVAEEVMRIGGSRNPEAANALVRKSIESASQAPAWRAGVAESGIAAGNTGLLSDLMRTKQPTEVYLTKDGKPRKEGR